MSMRYYFMSSILVLKKKSYSIRCLQDVEQYELFHGSGEFGFDSIIF